MARRIQAVSAYRPKLSLRPTAGQLQVVKFIARNTGLDEGQLSIALKELRDAVIFYCQQGQGVKLEGLGTFLPDIGLDGTITISHRPDKAITTAINTPREFTGEIMNRENIGKTADELVAQWNAAHPADPVTG